MKNHNLHKPQSAEQQSALHSGLSGNFEAIIKNQVKENKKNLWYEYNAVGPMVMEVTLKNANLPIVKHIESTD
jgi:hypothetical protein